MRTKRRSISVAPSREAVNGDGALRMYIKQVTASSNLARALSVSHQHRSALAPSLCFLGNHSYPSGNQLPFHYGENESDSGVLFISLL